MEIWLCISENQTLSMLHTPGRLTVSAAPMINIRLMYAASSSQEKPRSFSSLRAFDNSASGSLPLLINFFTFCSRCQSPPQ